MSRLPFALASFAFFASTAQAQEDDEINDLLKSIPTIESKPDPNEEARKAEEAKKAAEEADSLPAYLKVARQHILQTWSPNLKTCKKSPELTTKFMLKVAADGAVQHISLVQSSENKGFDQSALDAISAAGKLPAPPEGLAYEAERGIVIEFRAKTALKRAAAAAAK
jgi:TonB family protein